MKEKLSIINKGYFNNILKDIRFKIKSQMQGIDKEQIKFCLCFVLFGSIVRWGLK